MILLINLRPQTVAGKNKGVAFLRFNLMPIATMEMIFNTHLRQLTVVFSFPVPPEARITYPHGRLLYAATSLFSGSGRREESGASR